MRQLPRVGTHTRSLWGDCLKLEASVILRCVYWI